LDQAFDFQGPDQFILAAPENVSSNGMPLNKPASTVLLCQTDPENSSRTLCTLLAFLNQAAASNTEETSSAAALLDKIFL